MKTMRNEVMIRYSVRQLNARTDSRREESVAKRKLRIKSHSV